MKRNTRATLQAWHAREPSPQPSIWTDGETIWSYGTAIATRTNPGAVILNRTKYSSTTSGHQNALLDELGSGPVVTVDGIEQGADAARLLAAGLLKLAREGVTP